MCKKFHILICILLLHFLAIAGRSATLTVTTLSDSFGVVGSLRDRINTANAGDTIVFQAGLSGPISLINQIVIDKNLVINGPGADVVRVSGLNMWRVFSIQAGNVQISGLRITQGSASGAGGGVLVDGGNLTLNNCQINANDAESGGGALVFSGSTLTIMNSTINGNSSAVEGGGVSNRGGTLFLTNTTINGNIAPRGGGVSVENGAATILNSTISGNSTGDSSTSNVGGLRINSFPPVLANVILKNTIVANNSASFAPIVEGGETAVLPNTDSIGNTTSAGIAIADVGGTVNSQGNNLIGNSAGGNGFITTGANADLLNQNPQLAALAFNGGTTPTQALMAGSPAIDAGNNTGAPVTDQRGVVRPQNASADIGAFESGVAAWNGATATGTNITVTTGTVTTNFLSVGTAGTTTAVPINPADAGTVPSGYSLGAGFPAYEITTTAGYTAPITVCLKVSNTTPLATFNALRILHYVNGTPTDATILLPNTPAPDFATKTICARVNSLSPFVVAENLAPTAANVSVGGRVSTFNGSGISRARVSITNQNGETRFATTNTFGFYRFNDVPAGETYVIGAAHKSYQFNSRVLTVSDEIRDADFTAEPE